MKLNCLQESKNFNHVTIYFSFILLYKEPNMCFFIAFKIQLKIQNSTFWWIQPKMPLWEGGQLCLFD